VGIGAAPNSADAGGLGSKPPLVLSGRSVFDGVGKVARLELVCYLLVTKVAMNEWR